MAGKENGGDFWTGFLVGALVVGAICLFINLMLNQGDNGTEEPQAHMIHKR